jgi:hypothetical protein
VYGIWLRTGSDWIMVHGGFLCVPDAVAALVVWSEKFPDATGWKIEQET